MKVTHVETFPLNLPFYPRVEGHMHRASTHGERVEVCRVETDAGWVGYGEGGTNPAQIGRVLGRPPAEFLFDDAVGLGLQIALLDAVGQAEGVPLYRLLGTKVRDWAPLSWWAIDMPPEDWVAEAREAVRLGYTSFKLKARPWRDILDQVDALSAATPDHLRLDVDFNMFLLNPGNALRVLRELDQREKVAFYESPLPQGDVAGNRFLRSQIRKPIAMHCGLPPLMTALREDVCDGFVIGGAARSVLHQAVVAAEANKPFWLQMVGTGIMTAFTLHLGAVLSHAQWPAITCHELWQDDLLTEPLEVVDGYVRVPESPGLGVEVDAATLERYRVAPGTPTPKEEWARQRHVLRVRWPDGRTWAFPHEPAYQRAFYDGSLPVFERGVTLEVLDDDGSAAFQRLHEAVQVEPVREQVPL
jgi:L-alanine-DL-glutamate epimerase-like enolase superfamily enzyme